jgi:hypothetical protein
MTDPVDHLRTIALALPEVSEKPSHGEVSFFCRKQFVMLDDHHHGADHLAFWAAAPPGAQEELRPTDRSLRRSWSRCWTDRPHVLRWKVVLPLGW